MPRVIPSVALLATALVLAACAAKPDLTNHLSDSHPEEPPSPAVPVYIPLEGGYDDLSGATTFSFLADDLYSAGWFSSSSGGSMDFENGRCLLELRVDPLEGLAPGESDAENTVRALVGDLGTKEWGETLPMTWPVNGGESTMEAVTVATTNEIGERVVTMARALGDIGQRYLLSLTCAVGVVTETVFVDTVVPAVSVELR